MNDRYQPKHFEENTKDMCAYCHRTPAIWQQVGGEKECAHCGTRVYISMAYQSNNLLNQAANR
jgi:hypothetical protein